MPSRNRLTRDDWLAAARKVLVTSSIDDVKIDRLARRMKVTRGSFYWHFDDRKALLDALLADWEANNRREIGLLATRLADAQPDLSELFRIWLSEDPSFPAFDMAIRFWARKTAKVADVVRQIDEAWIGLLQRIFAANGVGEPESLVRARVIYFHQIGYYALAIKETVEARVDLAPTYYAVLTGSAPPQSLPGMLSGVRSASGARRRKVAPDPA